MCLNLTDTRSLPDEVVEQLRQRAIRARQKGYPAQDIADILGLTKETVSRWWTAFQQGGPEALPGAKTGKPTGSGRTLSLQQENRLKKWITEKCPDDLGIASSLWTRRAVAELIEAEFEIDMPIRTVGEYLSRWEFTPQKPLTRAYEQDPEAVRRWLEEEYPEIEAEAHREGGEIYWGDETGVFAKDVRGRSYAPRGDTPEVKASGKREKVNMISAITAQGQIRWMLYEGTMTGVRFIEFLERLIARSEKKIFLIVDNLRAHDTAQVRRWLSRHNGQIKVCSLPAYSPELNPDEYLNADLKGTVHQAHLPRNQGELKSNVMSCMRKIANLSGRVASYFQHAEVQYAANS